MKTECRTCEYHKRRFPDTDNYCTYCELRPNPCFIVTDDDGNIISGLEYCIYKEKV